MKEYVKCLYYENACFDNPIVTVRDGQDRKHLTLEEVVDLLNEQQATIRKLQDLCGESDGENAKLRIENKEQQEIIEAKDSLLSILSKENLQLRQQHQRLYNYFRDYLEDEISAENFGEMWDNVKEDERWNDE